MSVVRRVGRRFRSAISGRFVSREDAALSPATTVSEAARGPRERKTSAFAGLHQAVWEASKYASREEIATYVAVTLKDVEADRV